MSGLLTAEEQDAFVAAYYRDRSVLAVCDRLGLCPEAWSLSRQLDERFAARLDLAEQMHHRQTVARLASLSEGTGPSSVAAAKELVRITREAGRSETRSDEFPQSIDDTPERPVESSATFRQTAAVPKVFGPPRVASGDDRPTTTMLAESIRQFEAILESERAAEPSPTADEAAADPSADLSADRPARAAPPRSPSSREMARRKKKQRRRQKTRSRRG